MTDRELMQQALDALEAVMYGPEEEGVDYASNAIDALRERLAQPVPVIDKLGCVPAGDTSQERVVETEKQRHEQKPVAWIYRGSKVKEKT